MAKTKARGRRRKDGRSERDTRLEAAIARDPYRPLPGRLARVREAAPDDASTRGVFDALAAAVSRQALASALPNGEFEISSRFLERGAGCRRSSNAAMSPALWYAVAAGLLRCSHGEWNGCLYNENARALGLETHRPRKGANVANGLRRVGDLLPNGVSYAGGSHARRFTFGPDAHPGNFRELLQAAYDESEAKGYDWRDLALREVRRHRELALSRSLARHPRKTAAATSGDDGWRMGRPTEKAHRLDRARYDRWKADCIRLEESKAYWRHVLPPQCASYLKLALPKMLNEREAVRRDNRIFHAFHTLPKADRALVTYRGEPLSELIDLPHCALLATSCLVARDSQDPKAREEFAALAEDFFAGRKTAVNAAAKGAAPALAKKAVELLVSATPRARAALAHADGGFALAHRLVREDFASRYPVLAAGVDERGEYVVKSKSNSKSKPPSRAKSPRAPRLAVRKRVAHEWQAVEYDLLSVWLPLALEEAGIPSWSIHDAICVPSAAATPGNMAKAVAFAIGRLNELAAGAPFDQPPAFGNPFSAGPLLRRPHTYADALRRRQREMDLIEAALARKCKGETVDLPGLLDAPAQPQKPSPAVFQNPFSPPPSANTDDLVPFPETESQTPATTFNKGEAFETRRGGGADGYVIPHCQSGGRTSPEAPVLKPPPTLRRRWRRPRHVENTPQTPLPTPFIAIPMPF